MSQARCHSANQVEKQKPGRAKTLLNIVRENQEKPQVPENMHEVPVQKLIGDQHLGRIRQFTENQTVGHDELTNQQDFIGLDQQILIAEHHDIGENDRIGDHRGHLNRIIVLVM
jgi:hypothetical protein